mgnify:CR=1 FL=1
MKCKKLEIPDDVCLLQFSSKKHTKKTFGEEIGLSVRGEIIIFHYDKKGHVVLIELLGSSKVKKPCQES